VRIVELESGRVFDPTKMRKNPLFETARLLGDLYCLEAGQAQRPHAHADEDKVYVVLEGEGTVRVGDDEAAIEAGQAVLAPAGEIHGISNEGPDRLVCLVFLAPPPRRKPHPENA
jgi:mannose-6-phosphate isomerase-like protein (cupin superfamily)